MSSIEALVKTVVADLGELHESELMREHDAPPLATDAYERFFLTNSTWISVAEKTLSSALFFVPDRYGKFELPTEILYAFINQLGTVHDTIWIKFADVVKLGHHVSFLDKSIVKALRNSPYFPSQNRFLAFALSSITNFELLLELIARHLEDKSSSLAVRRNLTWTVIAAIEADRAAIRTRLLMLQGGSMLAYQRIPARPNRPIDETVEDDQSDEKEMPNDDAVSVSLPVKYFDFDLHRLEEENKTFMSTTGPSLTVLDLMQRQKKYEETKAYLTVMEPTPPTLTRVLAELLWIYRPLVYLFLLYRYGATSWKPWFTSLVLDLASRRYNTPEQGRLKKSEESEMTRRCLLWFYYLLRSPFFETFIARSSSAEAGEPHLFTNVPLIGNILGSLVEFMRVYKTRYFYTAGSS